MLDESIPVAAQPIADGKDLQLLNIRAVTGRIEALLSWVPDSALRREAEGTDLHLSSHVLDTTDGRVILWDGPRALPCRGNEGNLAVLPLEIPLLAGRYRVQIDPVVEFRFWLSQRGHTPLVLDAERRTDGSVQFQHVADGRRYIVDHTFTREFSVDTPLYGLDDSERCIEIPWVLSRYRGESRVLDVGYANAESRYSQARDRLNIPFLVGLDLAAVSQSGLSAVAGDALSLPFRSGAFDLVMAISVIEHIGRDNSIYHAIERGDREFGDLDAAAELASALRPGGRMLITLPFGRLEDHGWFIQYNRSRLIALLRSTACELNLVEYYADSLEGWTGPLDPESLGQVQYRTGFAARAVACLELTRPSRPGSGYPRRVEPDPAPAETSAKEGEALPAVLSPATRRVLKLSGAWSKMRGETDRMRPIMLFCETVNICNADCVFCPYSAQTRARGSMTSALFEAVLSGYRELGGGYLTLTPMVGEVLLDRLWMERVQFLSKVRDQIIPSITTNLYALERYPDHDVIEMLKVLRRIQVSCYGITPEECEAITRRNSFGRFLTQIRRLLGLRQAAAADCSVHIGFRTLKPRTSDELETFLKELVGAALPYATTHQYANWGNFMRGQLPGEASWFPERTNQSPCVMLPLAMQIYWDGRVSACSCCDYDSSTQLFIGDLNQQSLSEIFNGSRSQEIWQRHESGSLQPICRNCTFHVPLADLHPHHPIIQNPWGFIGG